MIKYQQYYIPIVFLFFNIAIAQDYKLDIHIQKNTMDNHYWWLEIRQCQYIYALGDKICWPERKKTQEETRCM